jgi:hypothetical protein
MEGGGIVITEDEAKTKWCPQARYETGEGGGNRWRLDMSAIVIDPMNPPPCRCIASACMAWRFVDQEFRRDVELWSKSKNERVNSAYSDDAEWRPVRGKKDDDPPPATGFCGLAGAPR